MTSTDAPSLASAAVGMTCLTSCACFAYERAPVASPSALPLDDLRVVELGQLLAGPFCGQLLGDFGAEVIKVEDPVNGDPMRQWGREKPYGQSLWWPVVARNKMSVTADLRTARGQDLVRRMVAEADVLIENFRPGTLERWGLAPETLWETNPGLVVTRVTGFGQTGPYAARAGLRLDRRGDGRDPLRHRRPGPAAGPRRDLPRRLAGGDLRLPRHPGRAAPARAHRSRPGRRLRHLRGRARPDGVAACPSGRWPATSASGPARRCPTSRRATSTRPPTARWSSSPPTRTPCSAGWPT